MPPFNLNIRRNFGVMQVLEKIIFSDEITDKNLYYPQAKIYLAAIVRI